MDFQGSMNCDRTLSALGQVGFSEGRVFHPVVAVYFSPVFSPCAVYFSPCAVYFSPCGIFTLEFPPCAVYFSPCGNILKYNYILYFSFIFACKARHATCRYNCLENTSPFSGGDVAIRAWHWWCSSGIVRNPNHAQKMGMTLNCPISVRIGQGLITSTLCGGGFPQMRFLFQETALKMKDTFKL